MGRFCPLSSGSVVSEIFDSSAWDPVPGFDFTDITYHRAKGVGAVRVAFDRPEVRNAFRPHTVDELYVALERELVSLKDTEQEQRGYLPLQVKWTAIMGAVVALAMAISSMVVLRAQSEALTQQAIDSGASLSRFISVQLAIPVLGEDWITLESLVQDASSRKSFSYLVVSDHSGTVRSATDSSQVGGLWEKSGTGRLIYQQDEVEVFAMPTAQGEVFNFKVPILFNETVVGEVNIGLDTNSLEAALATTRRMMVVLAFAIVLAVSIVIYIFNKLVAKNLSLATQAIKLFGAGQLETRISKQRSDEFGDLFTAFNQMADSVEPRLEAGGDPGSQEAISDLDVSGITMGMVDEKTIVRGHNEGRDV